VAREMRSWRLEDTRGRYVEQEIEEVVEVKEVKERKK